MKLLLLLMGAAAMIGLAVPAHADETDDAFIASLQAAGFTFTDPGQAILAAKYVCSAVSGGTDMADVVKAIETKNSSLSEDKATKFTAIAASAYCPDAIKTTSATAPATAAS